MHDHGGRASERDRTRRIASLSPPVPTQECGHACIRAPHTVNAHAHKGQADGYERTRVPLARGGGRDAVFRASFGPENLPTFLVARANGGCTSVRRNFGGCVHPFWTRLDEDGETGWTSCRVRASETELYTTGEDGEEGERWTQCGSVSYTSTFRIRRRWTDGGAAVLLRWCGLLLTPSLLRDSASHRPDCLGYRILLLLLLKAIHSWIGRGRKNTLLRSSRFFGKRRPTPLDSLRWTILIAPFR